MVVNMTKPKYNIGDIVYHVLPESPKGLVVNGTYSLLNNVWQYLVAFSPTEEPSWFYEYELSTSKTF